MQSNEITRDQYNALLNNDLCEVFELHAHGFLIEVVAVSARNVDFCKGESFDGFTVAVGNIDGSTFANDGLHNVTCIGGGFTYHDDARFYAFTEHKAALTFALTTFALHDHVDAV